jgi:hypothetical protein
MLVIAIAQNSPGLREGNMLQALDNAVIDERASVIAAWTLPQRRERDDFVGRQI